MKSFNIVVTNKYLKPIQMYTLFFMLFKNVQRQLPAWPVLHYLKPIYR